MQTNAPTHGQERDPRSLPTTVAVLGVGHMGAPMAARLLAAGFEVRAWNRSPDHVLALIEAGATAAASPAEAAEGADIILTMLPDGQAVWETMTGWDGALAHSTPPPVWLQMSTVGIEWTDRLAALAAGHAVTFFDAPVSGSVGPAEAGNLLILASGPEEARARVTPVLDAMGRRTVWLGPAGNGNKAKLVLNNWLVDLVETTAETLRFASGLGVPPELIVEILDGAPIGSPYAVEKARQMLADDHAPSFALKHAVKDADLARVAARATGVDLLVTNSFVESWRSISSDRRGERDLSVVYSEPETTARRMARR